MPRLFRSLRFRLVLTFVAVVGLINTVLGLGGIVIRDIQVRARFDTHLAERADRIALWLGQQLEQPGRRDDVLQSASRPFSNSELYVLLRDASGVVLDASDTLRGQAIPMPIGVEPPSSAVAAPVYITLSGDAVRPLAGAPRVVRFVTRLVSQPGQPDLILQVGASLDELEESMRFLRTLFWIVIPAGLVVAGLAAFVVTDRQLGRLHVISDVASDITPEHLDQRIKVKGGTDEIGQVAAEVNRMLGRLERSFRAQETFLANASHELQTPVAVLLSEAQILQRRSPSEDEYRAFVRSVEQEMRQLSRMVSSLLSVTRMESGDLVRTGKLLPLTELVMAAVDETTPEAQRRGVRLHLELPQDTDEAVAEPMVRGEPELLRVMLENLLRNGVTNSPGSKQVTVALELDADQAVVTVSDEGPGIPEAELRSLFDRRPAPASSGRSERETGLGVSLAKTVAELHGGAAGVRNLSGRGVAFFVWLPLAAEPAPATETPTT